MFIRPNERSFYEAYYGQLVGCTVVQAKMEADDDEGQLWPTLTMRKPGGEQFVVELSQDPEGNGPGFMFGLDRPREGTGG